MEDLGLLLVVSKICLGCFSEVIFLLFYFVLLGFFCWLFCLFVLVSVCFFVSCRELHFQLIGIYLMTAGK